MRNSQKKCFMKFAWRHNLIYPSLLLLWILLRRVLILLLDKYFNFSKNVLFTLLMFVGEIFAGLIIDFYQKSFFVEKKQSNVNENGFLIFNEVFDEEEFKYLILNLKFIL